MSVAAHQPGPGQTSVWTYPKQPVVEAEVRPLRVEVSGRSIAETRDGLKLLERCHPPVFLFPAGAIDLTVVQPTETRRECEIKGAARLLSIVVGGRVIESAALLYDRPTPRYQQIAGMYAFFCLAMDACWVGEDRATPQPGGYFPGWVTPDVAGPFKGGPGTWAW